MSRLQTVLQRLQPARLELLSEKPIVLLDGAHNPNGIEALKSAIQKFLPNKYIIAITGMLADKDVSTSVKLLDGVFDRVYTVPVHNPRAMHPAKLMQQYARFVDDTVTFESAEHAFDMAFEQAEKTDCAVVICGSLYLAGEIRPYIINKLRLKTNQPKSKFSLQQNKQIFAPHLLSLR